MALLAPVIPLRTREDELEAMLLCVIEAYQQQQAEIAYHKKIAEEGEYHRITIEQLKGKIISRNDEIAELRTEVEDKDREIEKLVIDLSKMNGQKQQLEAHNRAFRLVLKDRGFR